MTRPTELGELYDLLSIVYSATDASACDRWRETLHAVLYGGESLADGVDSYGYQQNHRNDSKRKDYRRVAGNGERITERSCR